MNNSPAPRSLSQRCATFFLLGLFIVMQTPLLPALMAAAACLDGEHRVELTLVDHHYRLTLRHDSACRQHHHHTALVSWFASGENGPTHPDHQVEFAPVSTVSLEDAGIGDIAPHASPTFTFMHISPGVVPMLVKSADMIRVRCPYQRVPVDIERQRTVVFLV